MNEENTQQQTDIEQARERLKEAQQTKEARKDPRAGERPASGLPVPQKKNIRPVKKKPKQKKFGQRLKEAMFAEDIGNGSVTDYVFFKIFIPSVKQVLSNMANTAINLALGLDPKTRTVQLNTHVSNASRNGARPGASTGLGRRYRNAINDLEWDGETARDIYTQIVELIDVYGTCSLADAYAIMDLNDRIQTTDRNWGWTREQIPEIDVLPVNEAEDRWIVSVPTAVPLYR